MRKQVWGVMAGLVVIMGGGLALGQDATPTAVPSATPEVKETPYIYDGFGKRDPFQVGIQPTLTATPTATITPTPTPVVLNPTDTPSPTPTPVQLPPMVLQGIISSATKSLVMIDNELLRVGDKYGEVMIKAIRPREVVVEYGGKEFVLAGEVQNATK